MRAPLYWPSSRWTLASGMAWFPGQSWVGEAAGCGLLGGQRYVIVEVGLGILTRRVSGDRFTAAGIVGVEAREHRPPVPRLQHGLASAPLLAINSASSPLTCISRTMS